MAKKKFILTDDFVKVEAEPVQTYGADVVLVPNEAKTDDLKGQAVHAIEALPDSVDGLKKQSVPDATAAAVVIEQTTIVKSDAADVKEEADVRSKKRTRTEKPPRDTQQISLHVDSRLKCELQTWCIVNRKTLTQGLEEAIDLFLHLRRD